MSKLQGAEMSLGAAGRSACATSGPCKNMRADWIAKLARKLAGIGVTVLVGGLLTAALVRMSPWFDTDERLLDARLNSGSQAAARAEHAANSNFLSFYAHHLAAMLHGDLGESPSLL
jgi:hypothetical protein